jgi:adenylate kinase family enzyme
MVVIHIAGAPGSGKSTVGEALQRQHPSITVLDLDDVNREFAEGHNLVQLTRSDPRKFQALYQAHIDDIVFQARREGRPLVFVGIDAAILGSWPGRNLLTVDLHANVPICLDTPTELNVRRWIQRDMPELIDEFAESLKQDVAQYTRYRDDERSFVKKRESNFHALMHDFRPSQRTRDIERFKAYYKKRKFRFLPPEAVVAVVAELIR